MTDIFDKIKLPTDWKNELNHYSNMASLIKPLRFIESEIEKGKDISPSTQELFKAFEYCSFSSTKVVIFGQDPYFQKNVANGLAFSVRKNNSIPASLKNIFQEIKNDIGLLSNQNGCLKAWATQGVLLLNSSLSVEVGKAGSHSKIGWDTFIKDVLKALNKKNKIVYILWGNNAQNYAKFINNPNNLILTSSHPSPLSVYKGFDGCKHFSKCNNYLEQNNLNKINW